MFDITSGPGDAGHGSFGSADIGLGYVRFSDEGSNPRSLDQQLIDVLRRASHDGVFIPWSYICADYAGP